MSIGSRTTERMLILTRRVQETLVIGEGVRAVRVKVLAVRGNQVRVGIDAPKDIEVHREEVYERIRREREDEP
jgi:carbon storage regulator